jgi:hypothetical protein
MDEDDRLLASGVGLLDLLNLVLGDGPVVAARRVGHLRSFPDSTLTASPKCDLAPIRRGRMRIWPY